MLKELEQRLNEKADSEKAKQLQRFFKTGKGEYGEGDVFLGIIMPEQRKIVKEFKEISLEEVQELLNTNIHEKRMIALLILIKHYEKAYKNNNEDVKKKIYEFYLGNMKNINNWDLVDLSAPNIVGNYLIDKNREILYQLANSNILWEKRIAIISTAAFIRNNEYEDTIKITEILLNDKHDLIHKAVGWMLREIGKKDIKVLEDFLKKHYRIMPRTMLRYAIEKFPEEKRKMYLNSEI